MKRIGESMAEEQPHIRRQKLMATVIPTTIWKKASESSTVLDVILDKLSQLSLKKKRINRMEEDEAEQQPKRQKMTSVTAATTWESLPVDVIRQIQSFLPQIEAVRTSVLCKACMQALSTSPNRVFHQPLLLCVDEERGRNFLKRVDETMTRYHQENLFMEEFYLELNVEDEDMGLASSLVSQWLQIIIGNGRLKSLHLAIRPMSAKFLDSDSEDLDGCSLNPLLQFQFPGPCGISPWQSLTTLELHHVYIDDHTVRGLLSNINLESITLENCDGFKEIKILNLFHLRELKFATRRCVNVKIDNVPNLRSLSYAHSSYYDSLILGATPGAFISLTSLSLQGMIISINDTTLRRWIPKFPSLENLTLSSCNSLQEIRIISPTLKYLTIDSCQALLKVRFYAPKLVLLSRSGSKQPWSWLVGDPTRTEADTEQMTWNYYFEGFGDKASKGWGYLTRKVLEGDLHLPLQDCIYGITDF